MLALSATASAQVWTPHKRSRVHAMSSTTGKTRKPEPGKPKRGKSKVAAKKKKKKPVKHASKKHHRSDDDFTYTEEDYPAR